jgi:hypothetical protein
LLASAVVGVLTLHGQATAQSVRFDEVANLPFPGGAPTKESAQALKDELLFQRATQAYLWAMPAIMSLGMQVGSEKAFGGGYNVLPISKTLFDSSTLIITPNTVTMYAVGFLDLGKDGPLVVELPSNVNGFMSDYMAVPIPADGGVFNGDVGLDGLTGEGGSTCCCHRGTRVRCRRVITFTVQP